MIPKIDLNTTRNDPRPQMIPNFFTLDLKRSPKNCRSGMGKHFYPGDNIKAFYFCFSVNTKCQVSRLKMRNLFKMAYRLHKVIFSYINCLEFTFSVIKWSPLYQDRRNCSAKCLQFRPSLVAVCFVGLFTGRSVEYNNVVDAWFTTL